MFSANQFGMAQAFGNSAFDTPSKISVTAEPGSLGLFVDQVPGEDYLVVSALQPQSPLQAKVKAGDRLQGINGVDLKGWSLEKLAGYCKEHTDTFKNIDVLQAPRNRFLQAFTPGKKKIVAHKKSSPPKSLKRKNIPPPMSAFQTLRPPAPDDHERFMVEIAAGSAGIRVKMVGEHLTIYEVLDSSQIKGKVVVDNIVEGFDAVHEQKWDVQSFVDYAKKNVTRTRYLHLFRRKKTRLNPWAIPVPTPQKHTQAPPRISNHVKPSTALLYTASPVVASASATTAGGEFKYSVAQIHAQTSPGDSVFPASAPKLDPEDKNVRLAGRTRNGMDWDEIKGAWVAAK
jgi:hypothetical protein